MIGCLLTCEAKTTLIGFHSMLDHSREAPKCTKQTPAAVSSALASMARDNRSDLEACQDCPQTAVAMGDAGIPIGLLG